MHERMFPGQGSLPREICQLWTEIRRHNQGYRKAVVTRWARTAPRLRETVGRRSVVEVRAIYRPRCYVTTLTADLS